jgi:hypothetical protein
LSATLPFFEIASALVDLDHTTSDIVNADHREIYVKVEPRK